MNLLEGAIFPNLAKLAVPIMATSLIQMAYNMIDMIWIGKIGSGAVAAVGAAGMYMWLANGLSTLSKMGGQIKVGQAFGAGRKEEAGEYAASAIWLALLYGIPLALTIFLLANPFIRVLGLNGSDVIQDGITYLTIVSVGILFSFVNQVLTGIFTAIGNSTISFKATAIGLVVNIVLDPVLIFGYGRIPAMGVAGAAIATIIAQGIVMLLFIIACKQDRVLFPKINLRKKPNRKEMAQINKVGLPISVQSMVFTGISMVISRVIAGFGDQAVAVQKVGSQIESITWMTAEGFSAAVNSFVAQNYGAGDMKRVRKGYQISMQAVVGWGIFSTILLVFFPEPIFRIFITEKEVVPMGVDYLRILGYSQLFMCMEIATQGAFGGLGKTMPPFLEGVTLTATRIPLAMLLSTTVLGLNGIWWSISITSMLKGIVLVTWFVIYLRKYRNVRK